VDASVCPVCGEPNQCAMAADPGASDCWCFTAQLSDQALAAVPEEARGLVCICPRCAGQARPAGNELPR
jgi:hypothetical protein